MQVRGYQPITADALQAGMQNGRPDNNDEESGYALVNVLDKGTFDKEHIPGSTQIPANDIEEFERRYSKDKEIIVYCASTDCDASSAVAGKLAGLGFTRVRDFEAGMDGWKRNGGLVESSPTE